MKDNLMFIKTMIMIKTITTIIVMTTRKITMKVKTCGESMDTIMNGKMAT